MKRNVRLSILFLLIILVLSCKKEEEDNLHINELVAVWELDKFIDKNNNNLIAPEIQISFLENKCVTVFTNYNYGQGEFSINGNKVTIRNLALTEREYDLGNDNRVVSNLTGTYLINKDTLRILSDYDFDMILLKTQFTDPYRCDMSTLLIDMVDRNRYYSEDIFDTEYSSIYGKWFLYFVDGGWGEVEPYLDFYEFKKNGVYGKSRGFELLEYGKIDIIKIISEEKLVVQLIPENNSNPISITDQLLKFVGKDTIIINSCLGCYQSFYRIK